jgi:phage recombination protein Bet
VSDAPGTTLAPAPPTEGMYEAPQALVLTRQRAYSDPGTVQLIRNTVAKDCDDSELGMFLELSARYALDPFAKHIYAIKIKGRVVIVVARDGLLAIANRHSDYGGSVGDVVREHDRFEKWTDPKTNLPHVDHRYDVEYDENGKAKGSKGDVAARGKIVGGWAIVYRHGRVPVYVYADWNTYFRSGENPWRSHPDAMMRKVPLVMALRESFSIGGVVGEGELPESSSPPNGSLTDAPVDDYGEDPVIARKLLQLFDLLGYKQRKRTIMLAGTVGTGLDDEGRRALLHDLLAEAQERGIDVPELPDDDDVVDGEAVEEPAGAA